MVFLWIYLTSYCEVLKIYFFLWICCQPVCTSPLAYVRNLGFHAPLEAHSKHLFIQWTGSIAMLVRLLTDRPRGAIFPLGPEPNLAERGRAVLPPSLTRPLYHSTRAGGVCVGILSAKYNRGHTKSLHQGAQGTFLNFHQGPGPCLLGSSLCLHPMRSLCRSHEQKA